MRVDLTGGPELNLIHLIHYLHCSSTSKIEASKLSAAAVPEIVGQ